ncbi:MULTISPECIES: alanine racemase [Micromonospora]|uniref:Diaminopimelate decarboxylase n=1 Tax=Micromonospora maris TaxID=1003110 RepID=A0A9X0LCU1_9ACTN|nr:MULTISPECIES: alanine racemase [Micromonospora]AEB46087.1 diaminopimelate decarboxylase [Micromonospora maris AB-18-032]KUJ45371.1 diaminopimelate decarboxylase [Micromonospora maris]RUL94571.1 diaminopimelate decarboxylase [Verrucosispora sp. FIM060022]
MSESTALGGVPVTELVERFGTPLYVYDGATITDRYQQLRERLHPAVRMFYSLKANPNISVCALLHSLGASAEVSSLTELVTAERAGVPAEDIMFLGPGKSRTELTACLKGEVTLICESLGELALIDELAAELGTTARVVLRVNPSFAVKGSGLTMGGKPRQFGIDEAALLAESDLAGRHPSVRLCGFQAYLGTRFLSEAMIVENTARILDLAERLSQHLAVDLEVVDVGGGLGVAYFAGEQDLDVAALTDQLNPVFAAFHARHPRTVLVMELGRYLVGHSGTYAVQVRYVKESMGERFAVADGGTNHHMAAVGIGSFVKRNFPMRLLNRDSTAEPVKWNVTGPLCTPNDTIGKAVELPADVRPGDVIGVERSGAYGPTASPVHFLSHGYPAEVLIHEGEPRLVRTRDDVESMLAAQILHDFR